MSVLARFFPLAQVRVHVDRPLDAVRLAEEPGGLLQLALVCEHGRDEHLVVMARLAPLCLEARDEIEVARVAQPNVRLARHVEGERLERLLRELLPVGVRDAEARDQIRTSKVALLDVTVESGRLGHVDRLQRHVVEPVDARALETHDDALHALLVDGERAGFDRERAMPAEAEHVRHLGVPHDGLGVLLLSKRRTGEQVVHDERRVVVHNGELVTMHREVETADGRRVLDERHRERVVDEDLDDGAVGASRDEALAPRRAAHGLDVPNHVLEHPLALAHVGERVELQLLLDA